MIKKKWFARKSIAVGVSMLLFASLGHAQSSVTLYGLVDAGLLYTSKTQGSTPGQNAGKQFSDRKSVV